jgi:hypothetical protein
MRRALFILFLLSALITPVIALRDRKFPVEYIVAPDEGHGLARPVNNLAMYTAAEKFLAKHLGARYQEGGTPEVMTRLKEITVDPTTVVMSKQMEASAGAPQVIAGFTPGLYKHKGSIKAGDTSLDLSVTTTIQETAGEWKITETTTLPSGEISDTATFDKKALTLMTRAIRQGPVSIDLAFKDNRVRGKINVNGQEKPFDTEVGGPLFADGPGSMFALGALSLTEGYSVTFRSFDVQTMKTELIQLKVTASEKVTVPAGSFECYRVEMSPADGGGENYTGWIAKDSRKPVKFTATLPQMGGAKLTAELQ